MYGAVYTARECAGFLKVLPIIRKYPKCFQRYVVYKNQKNFGSETKHYSVLLQNKNGVDTVDRMVRSYSTKCMTRRWLLVLFYSMVDVSAINAFIIWQEINHKNVNFCMKQRRKFLISLGKEL